MLTDQLVPNLMFPNADVNIGNRPYSGNGAEIVEYPYIYMYDATGLTDAAAYSNLYVNLEADSDFALRRIFGLSTTAASLQLFDSSGSHRYMDKLEQMPDNYAIAREIVYPANGQIRFNLGTVTKGTMGCEIGNQVYKSYIGFQGAKRFMPVTAPYQTPFKYKRLPYQYSYSFTLDWTHYLTGTTTVQPARPQWQQISNYDFELHAIRFRYTTAEGRGGGGVIDSTGHMQILLYDAYGNRTSNIPVPQIYMDENEVVDKNGVFPVPPLVYPNQTNIRIDILSMLCDSAASIGYTIDFIGMQRYPL